MADTTSVQIQTSHGEHEISWKASLLPDMTDEGWLLEATREAMRGEAGLGPTADVPYEDGGESDHAQETEAILLAGMWLGWLAAGGDPEGPPA